MPFAILFVLHVQVTNWYVGHVHVLLQPKLSLFACRLESILLHCHGILNFARTLSLLFNFGDWKQISLSMID